MKHIEKYVGLLCFIYLLLAFGNKEFNFLNWSDRACVLHVVLQGFFSILLTAILLIRNIKKL